MTPPIVLAELSPRLVNWLTPVWILGMGVLAGLLLVGVLWAIACGIGMLPFVGGGVRKFISELRYTLTEGVLWPVLILGSALAGFGVMGGMIAEDPRGILNSIAQLRLDAGTDQT